jgi:hypothetical protein
MGLLSGSKLRLADACLFPFRADVSWVRDESRYSDKGRAFHALAEGDTKAAGATDLSDGDRADVETWAARWRESEWSKADWRHEVAFVFDAQARTARAVETAGPREYGALAPHEIPATVDLVLVESGRVTVADLKTGWQGDREPIEEHAQLRGLAAMACLALGVPEARIVALYVDADGVHPVEAHLDDLDIAGIVAHLCELAAGAANARPAPGPHCGDCPAALACPETAAQVDALARVEPVGLVLSTPEQASAALARLGAVQKACEQMRTILEAYADANGGVPVGNGKVWRRTFMKREDVTVTDENAQAVAEVLTRHGVAGAVEHKVSVGKGRMEEALRAQGKPAAAVKEVMADLRAINATRAYEIPQFRETKARE